MTARILVVDDVPANVKLLEARLSAEYFDVTTAQSGREALAKCEKAECDIVLLDVMMPDMDGSDVAMHLSENPVTVNIPVVFLTAIVEKEEVDDNDSVIGGRKFLAKPVKVEELVNCIERTLRK